MVMEALTPQPRKRSKLPWIIGGVVGFLLLACVGLIVIGAVAGGSSGTSAAGSTPAATNVPAAAGPTATAAGKWTAPGKGKIIFGSDYRTAGSGAFEVLNPQTTFKAGVTIQLAATFTDKVGATQMEGILSSVGAGGSESVIDKRTIELSSPNSNVFTSTIDTNGMTPGAYKVKYVRGGTILAEGQFTIGATAQAPR